MTQEHAARFFKAIHQDEALKAKLKATTEPEAFIQIAAERGYKFTVAELDAQIGKLTPEEFAAVINPGISPRRRLMPR
ncbi:Nif11-like leader peptide family natural product precursor [Scytonema millei]|uniref:Nif11-like leader peptide family natural product n=1 Tax=Scytonema millei VB511283 TaxID=1245923 RepID=A0A9X5EA37_9CYAN|nr:Nif11-like leader peptide family natural product precursor [Scytonema millei]NHC38110.1 Nif11-like leader peptide family natural product precursor [Scytonema millei VB511283]